jgi:hypothetical protein
MSLTICDVKRGRTVLYCKKYNLYMSLKRGNSITQLSDY